MKQYLEIMKQAATECGSLILDRSAMALNLSSKTSNRDVVTQYDISVQSALVSRLHAAFPEAAFITEENADTPSADGNVCFVIDPIDGTMNFVKHYHHSCISLGCLVDGKPVAGVVYDPYKQELFSAAAGMGAFLNDTPICVTQDDLSDTLVLFGTSPYNTETTDQTFDTVKSIYTRCLDVRRTGSAALDLCYVACGRAGLYFEARLSLWDYAAGALILTEAGGTVTKLDGTPLDFQLGKSSVLAGTDKTIPQSGLLREVSE